jgi:hypothetical protein
MQSTTTISSPHTVTTTPTLVPPWPPVLATNNDTDAFLPSPNLDTVPASTQEMHKTTQKIPSAIPYTHDVKDDADADDDGDKTPNNDASSANQHPSNPQTSQNN